MSGMVRKQLYLTADLNGRLRRKAASERRSEAEIIRLALQNALAAPGVRRAQQASDPLWGIIGLGASDHDDVSERVDDFLYGAPRP